MHLPYMKQQRPHDTPYKSWHFKSTDATLLGPKQHRRQEGSDLTRGAFPVQRGYRSALMMSSQRVEVTHLIMYKHASFWVDILSNESFGGVLLSSSWHSALLQHQCWAFKFIYYSLWRMFTLGKYFTCCIVKLKYNSEVSLRILRISKQQYVKNQLNSLMTAFL